MNMKHLSVAFLTLSVLLVGCSSRGTVFVEPATDPSGVNVVSKRISDQAIDADLKFIESLRTRLKKLNEQGWPIEEYHHCKAQAWVDFAYDEYTDNDRSAITEATLEQAAYLIQRMEAKDPNISLETPIVRESSKVRPDMWEFIREYKEKGLPKKNCEACCHLAKLEVRTVWVGHEYQEMGWRHAEPEIIAMERLKRLVTQKAPECFEQPAIPAAPLSPTQCPVTPAPVCVAAPIVPRDELAPDVVHFSFDKSVLSNESQAVLARVVQVMRDRPGLQVTAVGLTDVRGGESYNIGLGQRRADAVRSFLIVSGVEPSRIKTRSVGENVKVDGDRKRAFALARRVELEYVGADIKTERQLLDLQPDY